MKKKKVFRETHVGHTKLKNKHSKIDSVKISSILCNALPSEKLVEVEKEDLWKRIEQMFPPKA